MNFTLQIRVIGLVAAASVALAQELPLSAPIAQTVLDCRKTETAASQELHKIESVTTESLSIRSKRAFRRRI